MRVESQFRVGVRWIALLLAVGLTVALIAFLVMGVVYRGGEGFVLFGEWLIPCVVFWWIWRSMKRTRDNRLRAKMEARRG